MNKKYVVVLTEAERERLRTLLSAGAAPTRMLTPARPNPAQGGPRPARGRGTGAQGSGDLRDAGD